MEETKNPEAKAPDPQAKTSAASDKAAKSKAPAARAPNPDRCINRVWGARPVSRPGKVAGLEPFADKDSCEKFIAAHGLDAVAFPYQTAWLAVERWHTKHVKFAAPGRVPFRSDLAARQTIRLNPDLGSRRFGVLPWGAGFAIVPRDLEQTLRLCAPSFVRIQLAPGAANDESVVAVQAGTRAVIARNQPVSVPYAVYRALADARGPVVDPDMSGNANSPGYKVRGQLGDKYPLQVLGPASSAEHRREAEFGRNARQAQLERLANEERLREQPTSAVYGMDGDGQKPSDDAL